MTGEKLRACTLGVDGLLAPYRCFKEATLQTSATNSNLLESFVLAVSRATARKRP